jgi:hypothetical protein
LPELNPTLVIRPHRSGYVFGAVVLLLGAIAWAIAQALGSIRSQSDLILAWLVFGGLALYAISDLLGTAVPKVVVDGDTVEVRDRLGRHRQFARSEVSHGAMRSIFAPRRYGNTRTNAFLLVSKDGRCLVRLPEEDYDPRALESLVATLGLEWPQTKNATVRQINREFRGAFAFDYQTVAVVILIILAAALAGVVFAKFRWV